MTETNGNGHNGNGNNGLSNGYAEVPYRGTIIVDADSLFRLSAKIPQKDPVANSKDIEADSFLKLLPFLAGNGYRIVIPEMVLIESGNILKSGYNTKSFNGNQSSKLSTYSKGVLTETLKDAVLQNGDIYKEHSNITVLGDTGPKEVDDFCASVGMVAKYRTQRLEEVRKYLKSRSINPKGASYKRDVINEEASFALDELTQKRLQQGYGDKAILSIISKNSLDNPVFLLSDDANLRGSAKSLLAGNGGVITTSGLIYGLVFAGLVPEIKELRHFTDDGRTEVELAKYLDEHRKRENAENKLYIRNKQQLMDDKEYVDYVNSRPFAQSLRQLADDLKKRKPSEDIAIENGNGNGHDENSPLAKYYKKYGSKANQSDRVPSR
ncbi:MAG: hypothetical protein ABL867_04800 [Rickettsiales bacterium]